VGNNKKSYILLSLCAVIVTATILIMGHFDSPEYNVYVPVSHSTISSVSVTEILNDGRINLNTATADELMKLESIGKVRAQKIIEYREDNGGFVSVEEIINIDGISSDFLEKNFDKITV